MPLSTPNATRDRLHRRTVTFDGFRRADGLFDIEAHLVDVKDQDYPLLSGVRRAGEAVHDMWARVTIDREFFIRSIEVVVDRMPYPGGCDRIVPDYGRLVGANLVDGYRKQLARLFAGVHGCTHITEMLAQIPTAAFQTFASLVREDSGQHKPAQLDRCHALESSSDTVRRYYPRWYRGAA